jgi:hypothetical protein
MPRRALTRRMNFTVDYLVGIADVFEVDLETLVRVDLTEEAKKRLRKEP